MKKLAWVLTKIEDHIDNLHKNVDFQRLRKLIRNQYHLEGKKFL